MTDDHSFLLDSVFCEWAYIINLDTKELEVYRGWNEDPTAPGRYASLKEADWTRDDGIVVKANYYGVTLLTTIPLMDIRRGSQKNIDNHCTKLEKLAYPQDTQNAEKTV